MYFNTQISIQFIILMNFSQSKQPYIQVVTRINLTIRNKEESFSVKASQKQKRIILQKNKEISTSYQFDRVFDQYASQQQIYLKSIKDLVVDLLNGYNVSVFAYGTTGSGKTHTIFGNIQKIEQQGMIIRAYDQILSVQSSNPKIKYVISCSFVNITNQKVFDLLDLSENKQRKQIQENKVMAVSIKNLTTKHLMNKNNLLSYIKTGLQNKVKVQKDQKSHSSKSSCIFTIYVESVAFNGLIAIIKKSKINFTDLLGSQKHPKTDKSQKSLEPSIQNLNFVINQIIRNQYHPPYQKTKLTHILRNSFNGNAKSLIIVNVAPLSKYYSQINESLEIISGKARKIKNCPRINQERCELSSEMIKAKENSQNQVLKDIEQYSKQSSDFDSNKNSQEQDSQEESQYSEKYSTQSDSQPFTKDRTAQLCYSQSVQIEQQMNLSLNDKIYRQNSQTLGITETRKVNNPQQTFVDDEIEHLKVEIQRQQQPFNKLILQGSFQKIKDDLPNREELKQNQQQQKLSLLNFQKNQQQKQLKRKKEQNTQKIQIIKSKIQKQQSQFKKWNDILKIILKATNTSEEEFKNQTKYEENDRLIKVSYIENNEIKTLVKNTLKNRNKTKRMKQKHNIRFISQIQSSIQIPTEFSLDTRSLSKKRYSECKQNVLGELTKRSSCSTRKIPTTYNNYTIHLFEQSRSSITRKISDNKVLELKYVKQLKMKSNSKSRMEYRLLV